LYETIIFDTSSGVATIALNRPKALNAFDGKMHEEVHAALDDVAADEEVRCLVFRGEGRGFSAGADLKGIDSDNGGRPDLGEYLRKTYSQMIQKMAALASLHGPVYGAGMGLALACDLRIAAESAKFSVAFVKIGLMPDAGVSFFLPRLVGLGRAMQMSVLGEAVEAEEAKEIGLINKLVPDDDLADETIALAQHLAALPTQALGKIRQTLLESFDGDLATALEREAEGQTFCGYTDDHQEGVAAFFEKRPPEFTGR
jgi:2-(1,2-epoxy-1,2-dihydrophenyl)acetyl-CoA isomerase